MEVVDVGLVDGGLVSELIRLSVADAPLDASPGEPGGEGVGVVVSSRLAAFLGDRKAAELSAPDDQGLIEEALLLEVGEERGDRLVGLLGEAGMVALDVAVAVPASLVCRAAGVDLHVADAALDHTAGGEALGREVLAFAVVEPVEPAGMFRFGLHIEGLGGGALHAVGELKALDPGRELFLVRIVLQVLLVQEGEQVELPALLVWFHAGYSLEIVDGLSLGSQMGSLENTRQEARAPICRVPLGQAAALGVAHDDEGREAVALAAETVGDPGAYAGVAHTRQAAVHHEEGGAVIVRFGMAGMDEGHLVDMLREMGEEGGDGLAAFSMAFEFKRALHESADGAAEEAGELIEVFQRLAVEFLQGGLIVPGIDLAGAAVDEQPDHRFGGGLEVRRPGRKGIESFFLCGPEQTLVLQEAHEPDAAEPHAAAPQHASPVQAFQVVQGFFHGSILTRCR